jgi:hypothetical protein
MKSILDRSFRYVPSLQTDVRKTFERIRREREAAQQPPHGPQQAAVATLSRDFYRLPGRTSRAGG